MEPQQQIANLNEGSYFKWNGTEYMVVLHLDSGNTTRCMVKGGDMSLFNSYTWVTPTQGETV